jgi:SAM-dependent methyltransferase
LKARFLDKLCCPACKGDLRLSVSSSEAVPATENSPGFDEIIEGALACACGKFYPIVRGVPRFVPEDDYVKNFSVQWNKLRSSSKPAKVQRTLSQFQNRTDFDLSSVKGEWVLEAGSGAGRFVKLMADHGAEIVGVDLSYGIDEVFKFVGRLPNVHLVHASIFDLPFKPASFDKIYSLGVLHHTPNTKKAFDCLPRLLKPYGRIAIWVYSSHNPNPWKFGQIYRKVTTKIPPRLLYYLCYIAVPMHYVYKIPVLGKLLSIVLRTDGHHPDPRFRVLNTFDYYAPKYQFLHRYDEVFGWFEAHGLERIRVLHDAVAVAGSMPRGVDAPSRRELPREAAMKR